MTNSGYFLYLAEGAAEWMAYFFLITLMLAIVLCAGIVIGWTASGSRRAGASSACMIPLLIPLCILLVG